jgi:electron transfer flavoprotein alpha subunit
VAGKHTHLDGVSRAGRIVAVNTDPSAPIFRSVDLGLIADWRTIAEAVLRNLESAHNALPTGWVAVLGEAEVTDRG